MAGLHVPLSTLHRHPHRRRRMTRGHRGSLLLRCRAFSSRSSRRFIPAHLTFHATAADQAHVASMPDTEWPVNGTPAKLIPEQPQTSDSDVTYLLTTLQQRITCVRLPDPHLTALPPPFPHRSPRRSSTNAARGGLTPSPAGRRRRANNPSSIAQRCLKKLYLYQPLSAFVTHVI
jgi:hypothetical protein